MSDDATQLREEKALLKVAPKIEAAGGNPKVLAPLVREYVRGSAGEPIPDEILLHLKGEVPEAFQKPEPPKVELSSLSERERMAFIENHGKDAYLALIARDSEQRRKAMRAKIRGF